MPKVTETRTQDHLREKVTHLNLADYLYDLEAIAKETSELDNLKINYVMNYENVSRYELHRLHAIECILWVRRILAVFIVFRRWDPRWDPCIFASIPADPAGFFGARIRIPPKLGAGIMIPAGR